MYLKLLCLFMFNSFLIIQSTKLTDVGDDFILEFIQENGLIVFFTKQNCDACTKYEQILEELSDDFITHANTRTVKAVDSHLVRLYSPSKEPAIVFFRHGVPLLYSGAPNENEIYTYFESNQVPAVKELDDNIFEHLTQAASGSTTGDWFVMFYGPSCVECQRLQALWEGVGATLKGRINVARIDVDYPGINTGKRFKVVNLPAFLLFRLGKVYRYNLPKNDIKSFVSFAQDWHKNVKGEIVPAAASPFDEVVDFCVIWIKYAGNRAIDFLGKNPWIWQIGVAGFGLVIITALIAIFQAKKTKPRDNKKEKKSK